MELRPHHLSQAGAEVQHRGGAGHAVEAEKPDKSAMPDDLHKKLSRRELRDMIEFLSSRK